MGDTNAAFFAPVIELPKQVLVPGVVVYEVCRRLNQLYGADEAARGYAYLQLARLTTPSWALYQKAAVASRHH